MLMIDAGPQISRMSLGQKTMSNNTGRATSASSAPYQRWAENALLSVGIYYSVHPHDNIELTLTLTLTLNTYQYITL